MKAIKEFLCVIAHVGFGPKEQDRNIIICILLNPLEMDLGEGRWEGVCEQE